MDFSPSPDSDTSGYYRNRSRRDERDRANRGRSKERYRNNSRYSRSRSRSYSQERYSHPRQRSNEREPYRDANDQGYDDGGWERERYRGRSRERDRDRRSRDRERFRDRRDRDKGGRRGGYSPSSMDEGDNFDSDNEYYYQQKPNNNIIIRGLAPQVTEADINSDLIQCGLQALHVRLIRKKKTGESRGFAFVEFRTEEEATRWICYKQGVLVFNGHHAVMQYTFSMPSKSQTDWYCAKCYAFNFKRRENCFKCHGSREDSEMGGDGSDEMSNILTKKIMLRNLDVLTNEESVLSVMQKVLPADFVAKLAKVVICRDPLTSISRGMCYLHFENLVDSMNTHNALKALEPPLRIDNREVIISYCMDTENRNLVKPHQAAAEQQQQGHREGNRYGGHGQQQQHQGGPPGSNGGRQGGNFHGPHGGAGSHPRGGDGGNNFERGNYGHGGGSHNSHGMNKNSGAANSGGGRNNYQDVSGPPPPGAQTIGPLPMGASNASGQAPNSGGSAGNFPDNYTLADVPRLAEYSASMYASNAAEHEHYLQYYTEYYTNELSRSQGPTVKTSGPGTASSSGMGETANSGAAVAQSAIARKQAGPGGKGDKGDAYGTHGMNSSVSNTPVQSGPQLPVPNGLDGRKYPTPDASLYQYDETSGFYYDPTTGLYYDANSQYYYNSETSSYLYWDPDGQTYVAAPASSSGTQETQPTSSLPAATVLPESTAQQHHHPTVTSTADGPEKHEKPTKTKDQLPPQDKVKVAKKIVKDMEKWAKQLNQKKDYSVIQPPARIEEATLYSSLGPSSKPLTDPLGVGAGGVGAGATGGTLMMGSGGYADVGFSLLEKKERASVTAGGALGTSGSSSYLAGSTAKSAAGYGAGSESDNDGDDGPGERDLVDFERLTCLLCKRAFQSQEILMKHLKMSSLHKENLQKLNARHRGGGGASGGGGSSDGGSGGPLSSLQYRDRAKERRQKYGEDEAPPVNRSKERFQRELEKQTQSSFSQGTSATVPIGQNNIGNKLLQKMGWSEGQGLGRSNQGRVNIIEAEARVANVGLGIKANAAAQYGRTTDDYKTYIKKMMKSRYEQVDVKD
ncbi:RNA-binding protein 5-B-like [Anopheles ziemanni]|uniref:RNA-binding protein 5-B-like n=1 Tax=Anopheles coustani TaxID=139045 RepID=UPI00265A5477|nr:RNA-binding protein 5-B-like [Anopheles coustani]XP_058168364.1 RNA-binding protein 5-B-like [Anopheles ziemanni]